MKKNILRILYGITLIGVTFISFRLLPLSFDQFHPLIIMTVISYVLLVATLLLAMFDRLHSRILRIVTLLSIITIGAFLLLLAFGGLLDVLGVQCSGLFGAVGSCAPNALFVLIVLISPLYLTLKIVLLLALLFGVADEIVLRRKPNNKKPTSK
ncbi:MAG TPA: hypothetical protein VFZ48_04850 [Candidatus Saccharimonadales bacterium]